MSEITVGEFLSQLQGCDPNKVLRFNGGLTFYRFRFRDDVMIEFAEIQAMLGDSFREKHPEVKVAFYHDVPTGGAAITEVELPIIEA